MNTHKVTFGIATFALVATAASLLVFTGCGGGDNTADSGPSNRDSGGVDSTTEVDSGKKPGKEAGSSNDGGKTKDASADSSKDAVSLNVGDCAPETTTCNSCYSDAQAAADPYNTCSPYTVNRVPFDPTRVPEGGVGPL